MGAARGVEGAPETSPPHPSRRVLVVGAVGTLAVAACEPLGYGDLGSDDPDLHIVRRAITAELSALSRYDGAMTRHPSLAAQLKPVRAEHHAHLRALRRRASPDPSPSASEMRQRPGDSGRAAPGTAGELRELARAERELARRFLDDLASAPPFLAQLLASMAAAETTHADVLLRAAP